MTLELLLHYAPMLSRSPAELARSSNRVRWALEELAIPHLAIPTDLTDARTRDSFARLAPVVRLPLLLADGSPIFESVAQLVWLGETFGIERGLYPREPLSRGRALSWLAFAGVSIHDAMHARDLAALTEFLGVVERALAESPWLAGDAFSVADIALAASIPYAVELGVERARIRRVADWSDRCLARAAFQRICREAGTG